MAASSGDDIPAQLAALLGRDVAHIRKTDEEPPRAAVYDVISTITGMSVNHAGKAYRDLVARHPEVHSMGVNFRFPGRGQRNTPVAPARGIVEIIMLLPGQQAARVRRMAAHLICRYLGGDLSLVFVSHMLCWRSAGHAPTPKFTHGRPSDRSAAKPSWKSSICYGLGSWVWVLAQFKLVQTSRKMNN